MCLCMAIFLQYHYLVTSYNVENDFVTSILLGQQIGQSKYVPNGHQNINNGSGVMAPGAASNSQRGTEVLSSVLAAAAPPQQKQMLGERLFPLVQSLKVISNIISVCEDLFLYADALFYPFVGDSCTEIYHVFAVG